MASVFRLDDQHVDKPNRNTFDMSYANNLTLKMGQLVPVYRQPVIPGDSVKIEPKLALRYLPQVFPTQTRQRASLKFYYVRNRNLWKDWPDFIGKTKQGLTPPYINLGEEGYFLRPSGLADYMGVPMRVYPVVNATADENSYPVRLPWIKSDNGDFVYVPNSNTILTHLDDEPFSVRLMKNISVKLYWPSTGFFSAEAQDGYYRLSDWYGGSTASSAVPQPNFVKYETEVGGVVRPNEYGKIEIRMLRKPIKITSSFNIAAVAEKNPMTWVIFRLKDGTDVIRRFQTQSQMTVSPVNGKLYDLLPVSDDGRVFTQKDASIESIVGFMTASASRYIDDFPAFWTLRADAMANELYWCDVDGSAVPFASTVNPDGKRISALPFRAFQSIYNALIRNAENNPLIINGQPEYNKYIISDEGGMSDPYRDMTERFANWADDRFTTALPSPQQGNAPLVGLTGEQGATLTVANEDGTTQKIKLQVDSDTGYVIGVNVAESDANPDLLSESWNAVDYGISINDLRNVNAYQRWKENNIRRGYKYKDQISAHYGISVKYDVLDMPEYIGGFTRDVDVNQITQTTENEYGNLGDIAGQSYVRGDGETITHFCDEHGWIIGILSVTPMPLYFDTLPKDLLLNDAFDVFFPEFSKIGPQPILNQEIAFSQSVARGNSENTFGYQRAWYENLERLDEVHGMYRDEFRNFLIGRDLADVPSLGSSFLTVDPEDVNNTFYTDDDKDKLLGQLYFDVKMKRPMPLYGIPSLE